MVCGRPYNMLYKAQKLIGKKAKHVKIRPTHTSKASFGILYLSKTYIYIYMVGASLATFVFIYIYIYICVYVMYNFSTSINYPDGFTK